MFKRFIALFVIVSLVFSYHQPVYAQEGIILPAPGQMVALSPSFSPAVLKGIKLDPKNPFRFHFFVDRGDSSLSQDELKNESAKLIKYFLASLTIPEKDLWVNLSPYEKDRIVPQEFGQTEMGRDLLAEDYLLKQITASLIYPESQLGKEFWQKVYAQAQAKYGTTNIPINTFNKVWIIPEKAVVYENGGVAFVLENHLKVMLEQDYLSLARHEGVQSVPAQIKDTNELGSQIVREIVIPALTKEVNEGKNFSQLRQVFYSLILATWYKKKIKDSILNKVYSNQNKIGGVNVSAQDKDKIYQEYLGAFKKGVFNYIKEEFNPIIGQTIPKKYFSGGVNAAQMSDDMAMVGLNKDSLDYFKSSRNIFVIDGTAKLNTSRAISTRLVKPPTLLQKQADGAMKAKKPSFPKKTWTRRQALWAIGGGVAAAVTGVWWLNREARWPVNFHFIFNVHASAEDVKQVTKVLSNTPPGRPTILFLEGGFSMDDLHDFMEKSINPRRFPEFSRQLEQDMKLIFNTDTDSLQTNALIKQHIQMYLDMVNKQEAEAGGQNIDGTTEWGQELQKAYETYKPQVIYEAANADALVMEAVSRKYLSDAQDALLKEKNMDKYLKLMDKHINAQYDSDRLRDNIVSKQLKGIAENAKSETDIIVYRGLYHVLTLQKTIEEFKKKAVLVKQTGSLDDTSKLSFDELLITSRIKDGKYHAEIPLDKENATRFFLENILLTELPLPGGQGSIKIVRGTSGEEVMSLFRQLRVILDRLSGAKLDEVINHVLNHPFANDVNEIAIGAYIVEQLKIAGVVTSFELQNIFNVVSYTDLGNQVEIKIKDDRGEVRSLVFSKKDHAMNIYKQHKGGIDFNPAQMSMNIKIEGQDFKFNFHGTEIDAAQVTGATFTIRTMTPVANLLLTLGLNQELAEKPTEVLLAKI